MAESNHLPRPSCLPGRRSAGIEITVHHRTLPASKATTGERRPCKTEFLAHWLGYESTHDMWLPVADPACVPQHHFCLWFQLTSQHAVYQTAQQLAFIALLNATYTPAK